MDFLMVFYVFFIIIQDVSHLGILLLLLGNTFSVHW